SPSPQITVFSKGSQDVVRPLHQHGPQIRVSFFTDVHLRLALSGVPAPRAQPEKTADVATLWEPLRIFQGQDIRQRDLRSYPLHLFDQRDLRVALPAIFSIRTSYSLVRSFNDSISLSSGSMTSRNSTLNSAASSRLTCCVPHLGSRWP